MKVIKLKSVHYINWKGIILTKSNPKIEATEENIEKLATYIKAGYLEVVDGSQVQEEAVEVKSAPVTMLDEFESLKESMGITTEVKRIQEYTKEELKDMNKAQLIKICEERGISFKKNMAVAKLEELILKNQ